MKKTFILLLALSLLAGTAGALDNVYKAIKHSTVVTCLSGRYYVESVTLSNPTTNYVNYDLWTTTATPSDGTARKLMITTVGVPSFTTQTFVIQENITKDFRVQISTASYGFQAWDGGKTHVITVKTK
jgi:hypothetical protein